MPDRSPTPINFRDGSGVMPSGRFADKWCAKEPGGDMLFVGTSNEPQYFDDVHAALVAIGKHHSRAAREAAAGRTSQAAGLVGGGGS